MHQPDMKWMRCIQILHDRNVTENVPEEKSPKYYEKKCFTAPEMIKIKN